MRILQVNVVCGIGSTGRIATDIHQALIQDGHESMIAFGRNDAKNCDTTYKIGRIENILTDVFMTRVFDRHGATGKQATLDFCRVIDQYRPDIVHLHNIHGYYLHVETLMKHLKEMNVPLVWTLHDCWSFTGHCTYFDAPKCDKWKTGCGNCPRKGDYPQSWLMDRSRKNLVEKKEWFSGFGSLTFVTPSQWLKDLVKSSYLSSYEVTVVPNGIDLQKFSPKESGLRAKLGLGDKKVVLGVAMSWIPRKGLGDMLKLAGLLGDDYRILLIGVSEAQLKKLPQNVLGIKRTSSVEELSDYYSMANVLAISSYEDNYPTVVLEALACQTPVVAYRTGGIPEMANKPYLTIVDKGDVEAMAETIRQLNPFTWELDPSFMERSNSAQAILDLYSRILTKERHGE